MTRVAALEARDTTGRLHRTSIERVEPRAEEIAVEIKYSGICHSDLHQIRGEWHIPCLFPMVPGHEMSGICTSVGSNVTKFKVGDRVGVGVFIRSCKSCEDCRAGNESYCSSVVSSYNAKYKDTYTKEDVVAYGGYSQGITVHQDFAFTIPDALGLDVAAPLLCAGITTYSPLVHFGAKKAGANMAVGVLGLGGLGHLCAKLSKAMGNDVTVISRSFAKKGFAEKNGMKYVASSDAGSMKRAARSLDLLISTVSADLDYTSYFDLLKTSGKVVLLGLPPSALTIPPFAIVARRISFAGSLVGGCQETQDMLEFCAKHQIWADIQLVDAKDANKAICDLSEKSDLGRYVIDVGNTMKDGQWEVAPDHRADPSKWNVQAIVTPREARIEHL